MNSCGEETVTPSYRNSQQYATVYQNFIIICLYDGQRLKQHIDHHQELKTALAASGFAYVKGCWTLRLLDAVAYAKSDAASAVLSS